MPDDRDDAIRLVALLVSALPTLGTGKTGPTDDEVIERAKRFEQYLRRGK